MFNNNFFLSNLDIFHMLLALAKTYMTMLNRSRESKHPCFVPDIRGNSFSFSSLQMMFTMGLSYTVVVVV